MRRFDLHRMRKRAGVLPPPETEVLPLRTWERMDLTDRQRIVDRLARKVHRAMPPGCRLHADLRVLDDATAPARQGEQHIAVSVSAERRQRPPDPAVFGPARH